MAYLVYLRDQVSGEWIVWGEYATEQEAIDAMCDLRADGCESIIDSYNH